MKRKEHDETTECPKSKDIKNRVPSSLTSAATVLFHYKDEIFNLENMQDTAKKLGCQESTMTQIPCPVPMVLFERNPKIRRSSGRVKPHKYSYYILPLSNPIDTLDRKAMTSVSFAFLRWRILQIAGTFWCRQPVRELNLDMGRSCRLSQIRERRILGFSNLFRCSY